MCKILGFLFFFHFWYLSVKIMLLFKAFLCCFRCCNTAFCINWSAQAEIYAISISWVISREICYYTNLSTVLFFVTGHIGNRRWGAQLSFPLPFSFSSSGTSQALPGHFGNCHPSVMISDSASVWRFSTFYGSWSSETSRDKSDPYFTSCYLVLSQELFPQIVMSSSAILRSLIKTNVISRNNTGFKFNKHNLYSLVHPFSTDIQPFSYSPSWQPTHRNKCFRGGCRGWYF